MPFDSLIGMETIHRIFLPFTYFIFFFQVQYYFVFDIRQVDIDELTEIADDFDVSSVPVLVVMKDGKVEKRMVGLQDTDKIRSWIQSAVK